ncbi:uncharacterized protein LOC134288220 isoform X2 [Aedes albopictus]|uniref:Uncharacterized protein n=1 Tax=Aedes albopictus TaxID=7160 RepID=A0ABM1Z214_AEDAL
MAYVVWRVLVKQYSKVRLGVQRNSALDEDVTPTTRRTKSFDDNAWKSQHDDESLNLSSNISAVSSVALSSARHERHRSNIDPDPSPSICGNAVSCGGGLDDILVIESGESDSHSQPYSHCGTLSRGEVRKSRSKMKSYLKRCKEALIGSQTSTAEDTCPITHHEAVVQHQQEPASIQIPTANWYLDDQLCEIRPEDNREPYSTFASARLKEQQQLETEEQRQKLQQRQQLGHENESTPPEPTDAARVPAAQDDDPLDSVNESDAAGGPVAQGSEARPLLLPLPVPLASSNLSSNGIEKLIDLHFGPLYPDYADHTRPVLIRQARDLLVCTFHGDLERFEAGFLRPAASIVGELKSSYLQGQVSDVTSCVNASL